MFGLHSSDDGVFGVVIDISSGSVGVAIIESKSRQTLPYIIFANRVLMRAGGKDLKPADQIRQMREALFSASLIVSREGLRALASYKKRARISKILVSCASPWSYTVSQDVAYQNDENLKITRSLIDKLVETAEQELESRVESAPIPQELGFQIVERATVDVRINDYPVKSPLGLSGQSIALSHITGLIPKDVTKAVSDVQEKILPGTTMHAHTLMLITYCVIRDLFPNESSYCIVNVTSEATEFGLVVNNTLSASMYIPYGSGNMYRDIMKKTGKTEADVTTLILAHEEQMLASHIRDEVSTYFEEYTKNLSNSFADFMLNKSLPHALVLITEPYMTPLYKQEFETMLSSMSSVQVKVHTLEPSVLSEIMYNDVPDAYIALLCRFFHKLHGCGEIDTTE